MNRKNKISTGNFLRSLILLVMMGWMGSAWAQTTNDQDRTIIAHFKEGIMGNVKFVIPDTIRVNGKDEKGNFKNAISIKPDDMLNVRSFTIPTNYTLFKSIDDKGNAVEQYYTSNTGHKKTTQPNTNSAIPILSVKKEKPSI